jgi:hypothetical protein
MHPSSHRVQQVGRTRSLHAVAVIAANAATTRAIRDSAIASL